MDGINQPNRCGYFHVKPIERDVQSQNVGRFSTIRAVSP